MAETTIGTRGERGDWRPYVMDVPAPLAWPPRPVALFEYMFGASPAISGHGTCSISALRTTWHGALRRPRLPYLGMWSEIGGVWDEHR